MTPSLHLPPPPGYMPHLPLRGPCDLRVVVGHVGEMLVARALGASPWRSADIMVKVGRDATTSTPTAVRPDLWWPAKTAIVEVKSALMGRRYYVTVEQLDLYRRIHLKSTWPVCHPLVYYAFIPFHHPYPGCKATRVEAGEKGRQLQRHLTVGEVMADLTRQSPKPVVVALPLVAAWARLWGTTGKTWSGPLSPMLGEYAAYYRFTVGKVETASTAPLFGAGRVGAAAVVEDATSARIISYPHPPRQFVGELPGATVELF